MERRNKKPVGPVCTCAACGNYDPRFGNHCDALRIAFSDSEKCWAKMSREKRLELEYRKKLLETLKADGYLGDYRKYVNSLRFLLTRPSRGATKFRI